MVRDSLGRFVKGSLAICPRDKVSGRFLPLPCVSIEDKVDRVLWLHGVS